MTSTNFSLVNEKYKWAILAGAAKKTAFHVTGTKWYEGHKTRPSEGSSTNSSWEFQKFRWDFPATHTERDGPNMRRIAR